MSEEIKIITLGDIFRNIETEEKAFKFKDYIKDLQQKVEQLQQENKILRENAKHNDKVVIYKGKLSEVIEQMKKDIKNETKENENMVNNKKH